MNKIGSFVVMWMYLESVVQSEVSKKEKQRKTNVLIYINIYMESRKMALMSLDIENRLVDMVREEEGETN